MAANVLLLMIAIVTAGLTAMRTAQAFEAPRWTWFPIGLLAGWTFAAALAIRLFPDRVKFTFMKALPFLLASFLLALALERWLPGGP